MSQRVSITTDQVFTFVELARLGSIRAASESLFITEQGARNRLIALERRLGVPLYRKGRGLKKGTPLTEHGTRFLPLAIEFLNHADSLADAFARSPQVREIHVLASQYLIAYVLVDVVRKFHAAEPTIRVRLSSRSENEIENALLAAPDVNLGFAAPYELHPELTYTHLFSMDWSLITPRRHPLTTAKSVKLSDVVDQPLIIYERGSTGRQHVMEAFGEQGLTPQIAMEATNTDLIIRLVAAGLGVAIVPLLPSGSVTRGHAVEIRPVRDKIRPIRSGILVRKNDTLSSASRQFVDFAKAHVSQSIEK